MNRTATLLIKLTERLTLNFQFSTAHWKSEFGRVKHGPQVWPWWLLFSISVVGLETMSGWIPGGRRIWFYTRWGALYLDFIPDRRGVVEKRFQFWVFKWR